MNDYAQRICLVIFVLALAAVPLGRGEELSSEGRVHRITSFESPEVLQKIRFHDVKAALVEEHATEGQHALKLEFAPSDKPGVTFPGGENGWDWRAYGALALDLFNSSDDQVSLAIRVDDDPSADGVNHSRTGRASLRPRERQSFAFPLGNSDPMEMGMRGGPPTPGVEPMRSLSGSRIDLSHITAFEIFLSQPPAPIMLFADNIRLLPPVSYERIADAFGQYTRADWPGKLKMETEFATRRAEEEAKIRSAPTLPDRDVYGGWASGPAIKPTGFFNTLKVNGKWWLVTPSGHLFFSLGMDVISAGSGYTFVEGREKMFTWLPDATDPLAKHYGRSDHVLYGPAKKGRTFNFYTANLERKYGAEYLEKWRQGALDRLLAWGFNTIGNWSDPALYERKHVPYTATIHISGDFAHVSSGTDYWGKMVDPFDPEFARAAERTIGPSAEKYLNDPWCIGYFVDNELSWGGSGGDRGHYGLAYGALSGSRDSPAKRAFLDQLKQRYGTVERLNTSWGTNFGNWESLLGKPFEPRGTLTAGMKEDFSVFLKVFARQYFRVVRDALKKYDPNHLYLGCRFAWRTPEAVEASAEFCDVVSFNIYEPKLDPKKWDFVNALDKPCIIGEFHSGALDRGMFHPGLVSVPNQQARAEMYREYVRSVLGHPAFVGCHWFQYFDEPLTGRTLDGENYNMGFVSVTDTAYPELVAAAKELHGEAYSRRAGRDKVSQQPVTPAGHGPN